MFIPANDTAPDGQVHAEAARVDTTTGTLTCRCGYTGAIAAFDQHLVAVFTPEDRVGLDGTRHEPA
jgi:hypothetical protein